LANTFKPADAERVCAEDASEVEIGYAGEICRFRVTDRTWRGRKTRMQFRERPAHRYSASACCAD